jgi:hypothetical protein
MKKSFGLLAVEALVVAVSFGVALYLLDLLLNPTKYFGRALGMIVLGGVTGALLHLLFEVTRVNVWYSAKYCNALTPEEVAQASQFF